MTLVAAFPRQMTVEEFEAYPFPDGKVELVRGEPRIMPPAGASHAGIESNVVGMLIPFVNERRLGRVFTDGLGYELIALPRTVRNPDASFVRADRLPSQGLERGFLRMAPDLAVEVLSPTETASALQEKLDDYRSAGTSLLWVIDPTRRAINVVSHDAPARWLHDDDILDGGNVLPGFQCPISALFDGIAPVLTRLPTR